MQLLVTFAFVLTLMYSYVVQAPAEPFSWVGIAFIGMLVCVPAIISLKLAKRLANADRSDTDPQVVYEKQRRLERLHIAFWIVSAVLVYGPLQWIQTVRFGMQLDQLFMIDELLILLPLFVSSSAVLIVSNWLDQKIYAADGPNPSALDWKTLRLQVGYIYLLPMLPVLIVLVVSDLSIQYQSFALYGPYFCLPLILGLPILLPFVLRHIWDLEDLPYDDLKDSIGQVLQQAKIKVSRVYLWHSNNRLVNAAVSGILPWMRYLLVTDGLIQRLNPDEIKAVVAHEAAHIRHRHLLLAMVSLGLPFGFSFLLLHVQQDLQLSLSVFQQCLVVALVFAAWVLFQRMLSRLMEHQADIEACLILGHRDDSIDSAAAALYCSSLEKMSGGDDGKDWWHPAISARTQLVQNVSDQPESLSDFNQRTAAFNRLVCGTVAVLTLANIGLVLIR